MPVRQPWINAYLLQAGKSHDPSYLPSAGEKCPRKVIEKKYLKKVIWIKLSGKRQQAIKSLVGRRSSNNARCDTALLTKINKL
ncbi:hypothetical protein [Vreelandella sp. EE22]